MVDVVAIVVLISTACGRGFEAGARVFEGARVDLLIDAARREQDAIFPGLRLRREALRVVRARLDDDA